LTRFGAMVVRVDERRPGADLPLLSVSQTRGVLRRSELTDKPPRAETLDVYKVCRRGDIVFNKMSIRAGAIGVAGEDGLVTYHYEVMRPVTGADARYLVYMVKSSWFIGELILRERGIGAGDQANVRTTEVPFKVLRTVDAYLPEFAMQRAIADYLEHETARIAALIAKQERLIATLRERQAADVEAQILASSGDKRSRLKHHVVNVNQGWSPQCYPWPADGVETWAVLKAGAANGGRFRPSENKELPEDETPRPEAVVRRGQLIVSRANTRELVGSAAVVDGDFPRLMLSDKLYAFALDTNACLPRFVALMLGTRRWRDLIEIEAGGTSPSMQNISQADILNLPMSLPPLIVQQQVVDHLDVQALRTDALVSKAENFIAVAKERRSALITEAVKGRINVPLPISAAEASTAESAVTPSESI
jgi:type I restriction enzyme S subunit